MRKESLIETVRNTAALLSLALVACRPTEQDLSAYVPIVVSSTSSPSDICFSKQTVIFHSGEDLDLLDTYTNDILRFRISVKNSTAVFKREGSQYNGVVKQGSLFGILYDKNGIGALPFAKLTQVTQDSITIDPVVACKIVPNV